jgi:hypothetical protein
MASPAKGDRRQRFREDQAPVEKPKSKARAKSTRKTAQKRTAKKP